MRTWDNDSMLRTPIEWTQWMRGGLYAGTTAQLAILEPLAQRHTSAAVKRPLAVLFVRRRVPVKPVGT